MSHKDKLIVRCYGTRWLRDNHFWGVQNNRGSLLGVERSRCSSQPVDFREQIGVYVLLLDGRPVRVGQTGSGNQKMFHRLKQHAHLHWNEFSWFGVCGVMESGELDASPSLRNIPSSVFLNHLESLLIEVINPPLNKQSGPWGAAAEYIQYKDERLGKTDSQKIDELLDVCQRAEGLLSYMTR